MYPIQTRSEENGLHYYATFREAFQAAEVDPTVWKISTEANGENVRFVRHDDGGTFWAFESIMDAIKEK